MNYITEALSNPFYETREIFGVIYHRSNQNESFKPKKDANGNVVKVVKR